MLKRLITLCLLAAIFASCTSTKIVGTYKSPEMKGPYDDIFVVGLVGDQLTDKSVAADIVDMLQKRKVNAQAIKGTITPEMELTDAKKKEISDNLKEKGFDSVLTFALVSVDEQENYVPGTYSTAAYYPMNYGYYGSYWGYYGYHSPQVYSEGYYTTRKVYTLEAALYDLNSEGLVWSARSETLDPTSVNSFSIEYAETVAYQMLKDGVVLTKKQKSKAEGKN
ncbi:MAG: hypothetical protein MK086_05360 [Flavobacteriales bacterium]|nr:hypothetical protein [Flavobacteriales bacterium]